ncbi:MAG: hypothetical protein CVV41_19400 [Candidatus Riflebacteria bacterium HGW-Riflebacteria-1]|nr:MAG: hypothetical protein CVV41_19400 [Candidatus Riflebacteria bacterium HGW-Riflebacteria-1]
MSTNSAVSKDLPQESLIFSVDSGKAAEALAKSLRVLFWVDVVVFLVNLLILYSWMFELGYLPDWQVISQLFFLNLVLFILRRPFSAPKGLHSFQIALTETGIILDDYYTREVIARERLQAVVQPATSGYLTVKSPGLMIDGRMRILPRHIIGQVQLIEELTNRFSLPLIDSAEAIRSGWQYSPLKIIAGIFALSFITTSVMAVIAAFTSGIARMILFLMLLIGIILAARRFITSLTHRPGAVAKRRNPASDLFLIMVIILVFMTMHEAANRADREQSAAVLPARSEFSSRLSVIDPPAFFAPLLSRHLTADEIRNVFEDTIASWPANERNEYERTLIETAVNSDFIAAKLEHPPGSSTGDLSLQPLRKAGRIQKFLQLFAHFVDREDLIGAIVRSLFLSAAELDTAQSFMNPGVAGSLPGTLRVSAVNLLRRHLAKSVVSRLTACELIKFSHRLEAVLPDVTTLLAVEDFCWTEQLRMHIAEYRTTRTDLSRPSYYPEPDDNRVTQLRQVLFEMPLPILQRYETGLATFPAINHELEVCVKHSTSLIESWGWRLFGTTMLPYQLRNLIGAMDCTYYWPKIWFETIRGRQNLHALGYIAGISAFQTETGTCPASLNELCAWLSTQSDPVELPRDLFTGHSLIYDIASGPRLFSAGPDGKPGSNDDIVLYP